MIGHEEADVSKAVSAGMETNGTISYFIFSTHLLFLSVLISTFANVAIHVCVCPCGCACSFTYAGVGACVCVYTYVCVCVCVLLLCILLIIIIIYLTVIFFSLHSFTVLYSFFYISVLNILISCACFCLYSTL